LAAPDDILLLNLTRLGDLVQTTPLAVALKKERPGVRVVVCAQKKFESAALLMDGVDEIVTIDYDALRKVAADRSITVLNAVSEAEAILAPLLERKFKAAVNLTHSRASAYLMYLLDVRETFGVVMNGSGHRVVRHPWMLFLHNLGENKQIAPFNLVDIYALGGGAQVHRNRTPLSLRIPESADAWAERFLEERKEGDGPLVAVQVTASDAHKMWHPSSFIRMCRILRDAAGARFLFVGTSEERELVEKVHAAVDAPGSIVAAGETDLPQLCALLRRADLMITNDTGPMHLAAAMGTPVVSLAIGPVYYFNTGPYGEGNVVFQPKASCAPCSFLVRCVNPECKNLVNPEAVAAVALRLLRKEPLSPGCIPDGPAFSGCEVYLSGWGEDGLMDFLPLLDRAPTQRYLLERGYRTLWAEVLLHDRLPPGSDLPVSAEGDGFPGALRKLETLAVAGGEASAKVLGHSPEAASHLGLLNRLLEEIQSCSREIRELGSSVPEANGLSKMFSMEEENMREGDLADAARENVTLFNNLLCRTRSLAYLLSEEYNGKIVGEKGESADAGASRR
jgi:ADP-heptose:LPS heptosyltransferase